MTKYCRSFCAHSWVTVLFGNSQHIFDNKARQLVVTWIINQISNYCLTIVLPTVVVLSPDKTSYVIKKGQTLTTITCQASTCWPVCSFNWTGPNFSSASSALMITNIDKSNSGQYMCNATNVIGTTSSDVVNVAVQCKFKKYGTKSLGLSFIIWPYLLLHFSWCWGKLADTKRVIRRSQFKKDRQYNGQNEKKTKDI